MSRLTPIEVALRTLEGKQLPPRCRISPAEALKILQNRTGQDFGTDAAGWRQWLRQNPECLKTFEQAPILSGTIVSWRKDMECRVRLDSGEQVVTVPPIDVAKRVCILKISVGLRVRVRVLEAGCSRIVDLDHPSASPNVEMIDPKEVQIDLINSSGGSFVRVVHLPTGISRHFGPVSGLTPRIAEQGIKEIEWEIRKKRFPPPPEIERIDAAIRERRPDYAFDLQSGATEIALTEVEIATGCPLPESLKHFFRWRNGQSGQRTFCNRFKLLPVDIAVEIRRHFSDFQEYAGFPSPDWWNPAWIPFLSRKMKDFLCLDVSDQSGRVIEFQCDTAARTVLFPSFDAFLKTLADALETSEFDEPNGPTIEDGFIATRNFGFPKRFHAGPKIDSQP